MSNAITNEKNEKEVSKAFVWFHASSVNGAAMCMGAVVASWFSVHMTDDLKLAPAAASLIMFIATFWDAVNDPIMGVISDRTNTRWGRYRPYFLVAPILITIYMGLISIAALVSMMVLMPLFLKLFKTGQKAIVVSQILSIVCYVILFFFGKINFVFCAVLTFISVSFAAMQNALVNVIVNDTIDFIQLKEGISANGVIASIKGFALKCGNTMVSSGILAVLSLTGYVAGAVGQQNGATMFALNFLKFGAPCVTGIILILCVWFNGMACVPGHASIRRADLSPVCGIAGGWEAVPEKSAGGKTGICIYQRWKGKDGEAPFHVSWLQVCAAYRIPGGYRKRMFYRMVPFIIPKIAGKGFENPAEDECSAAWSDAAVIIPWNQYVFFGDRNILREEYPGWLYEVNLGATTIWEAWDALDVDGRLTGEMSLNHYAFGSVAEWIYSECCGIRPIEDGTGFQKVRIEPEPDKRLGWISAEYHSVSGTFRVEWKYLDERQVQFGISVPDGATAYFKLPGDVQVQELESGEHKIVRRLRSGT